MDSDRDRIEFQERVEALQKAGLEQDTGGDQALR